VIGVEIRKQLFRPRTYIALAAMVLLPALITIVFATAHHIGHRRDSDLFSVATRSGLNMPLAALSAMEGFLLVLVVALFAGDSVAGEANWGTLRYLLVRPVARGRLLADKLVVVGLLALIATVLIPVAGLVTGVAAFGWHPVVTPLSFAEIPAGTALARLALATAYVAWQMSFVVAVAFFFSAIVSSPAGAAAAGVGLAVVSEILDGFSALGTVRYGLPTHYWQAWNGLFSDPTQTADMVRGALLMLPYDVVLVGLAFLVFRRRDVTS
jgi:ABC-2 type transport system permease protein